MNSCGKMEVEFSVFLVLLCLSWITVYGNKPPNIVLFLTDDQDSELGGMDPMKKTKSWIGEKGMTFENSFVSTPSCCPSRASILTGLYQQNTHVTGSTLSDNCWGSEWREILEKQTFATFLKSTSNYTTFYAGKYLNQYSKATGTDGIVTYDYSVPPGWDSWAGLCNGSVYVCY